MCCQSAAGRVVNSVLAPPINANEASCISMLPSAMFAARCVVTLPLMLRPRTAAATEGRGYRGLWPRNGADSTYLSGWPRLLLAGHVMLTRTLAQYDLEKYVG